MLDDDLTRADVAHAVRVRIDHLTDDVIPADDQHAADLDSEIGRLTDALAVLTSEVTR